MLLFLKRSARMSPRLEDTYRLSIHMLFGGHEPSANRGAGLGSDSLGINRTPLLSRKARKCQARLLHGGRIVELGDSSDLHCGNAHGAWFARRVQIAGRKVDAFQAAARIADRLYFSVRGWVEMSARMIQALADNGTAFDDDSAEGLRSGAKACA